MEVCGLMKQEAYMRAKEINDEIKDMQQEYKCLQQIRNQRTLVKIFRKTKQLLFRKYADNFFIQLHGEEIDALIVFREKKIKELQEELENL